MVFSNNSVTFDKLVHGFLLTWLATGQCMIFTHNSVTYHRSVLGFLGQFTVLRQIGTWFSSTISVTCDRSVHGFLWQFSDLRQVSTWFSLTIQWLPTGQCIVFSGQSGDLHKSNWPPQYKWNIVKIRWKTKKYHTVRKVQKSKRKIVESKSIPLNI